MQRGISHLIGRVDIRAGLDGQPGRFQERRLLQRVLAEIPASASGRHERSGSDRGRERGIGAGVEQRLHDRGIAGHRRQEERRRAGELRQLRVLGRASPRRCRLHPEVGIRAVLQEGLDELDFPARSPGRTFHSSLPSRRIVKSAVVSVVSQEPAQCNGE